MKKMILVYNPVSGDASFKNKLDMMIDKFQQRGCMLLLYRTERDNSRSFGKFLRAANADGVIVSGGDGTLHEIINLLMKEGVDLPVGLALDLIVGEGGRAHPARQVTLNDVGEKGAIDIGRLGITRTRSIALYPFETALAHQKADIFKDAQRARDRRASEAGVTAVTSMPRQPPLLAAA